MSASSWNPTALLRRGARWARRWLQRLIVPDYPSVRDQVIATPAAIDASMNLGRSVALKADRINEKLDALLDQFEAIRQRQTELETDIATIDALSWDRAALARRLAQIEDRLIALSLPESDADPSAGPDWSAVRFPGLDRYEERVRVQKAAGSVEEGRSDVAQAS